ncbi:MAG TPA: four helix bundle protein [Dehalococcoidia bacterium]|jgi:four helix bundle protein|nr:four helix bundle protein [Dehalococcoidia bacterium]
MKDFRSLKVWAKAHALALAVYKVTRGFPKDELYGLTSQMRRCATSVPSNLAEGCGRASDSDFARFVEMAASSALELEYQLLLSRDLEFIDQPRYRGLHSATVEVKQMLASLIKTLRAANGDAIQARRRAATARS